MPSGANFDCIRQRRRHTGYTICRKTGTHVMVWRSPKTMLGRDRDTSGATGHTTDGFAAFFTRKVDDVMTSTAGKAAPPVFDSALSSLSSFRECSMTEVRRIIMLSPIKSCSLDPVLTFLVREHVDLLLPYITRMVNSSLRQGRLPDSQKHALVTPLLKKPGLDTSNPVNLDIRGASVEKKHQMTVVSWINARLTLLSLAFRNNCVKTNTDRAILSQLSFTTGTRVSDTIKFMRIFAGFLYKKA